MPSITPAIQRIGSSSIQPSKTERNRSPGQSRENDGPAAPSLGSIGSIASAGMKVLTSALAFQTVAAGRSWPGGPASSTDLAPASGRIPYPMLLGAPGALALPSQISPAAAAALALAVPPGTLDGTRGLSRAARKLLGQGFGPPQDAQVITPIQGKQGIEVPSTAEQERSIEQTKKEIIRNCGGDPDIADIALAIGGLECRYDVREVRADQDKNDKKGTELEELGIFRISRYLVALIDPGKVTLESKMEAGDVQASCDVLEAGLKKWGREGYILRHRGGRTAHERIEAGKPPLDDDKAYLTAVNNLQKTVATKPELRTDGRWAWVNVPRK